MKQSLALLIRKSRLFWISLIVVNPHFPDGTPIEFDRNKKGNYVWRHIESRNNESFVMFLHLMGDRKMMFVTNAENEIAKMQVDVNGITLEQDFIPYQATVTWVDIPGTNEDSYEYRNYKYYDENGNLIEEF